MSVYSSRCGMSVDILSITLWRFVHMVELSCTLYSTIILMFLLKGKFKIYEKVGKQYCVINILNP